ncbi:MAG: 7TM diverse intracellular signaling domain-containing protein [Owenweeksia sp.]|nr:7TM diverse intracellular signaling domain-containing protein [Owenweeksia sp.]
MPIKIYSEQTIVDKLGSWDFGRGLFYGIMAVMFLYNLFVSLSTKDRAYYYYVIYVLFITLTQTVLDGTLKSIF